MRSAPSVAGGLPWRRAAQVLAVVGDVTDEHTDAAHDLGDTLVALPMA